MEGGLGSHTHIFREMEKQKRQTEIMMHFHKGTSRVLPLVPLPPPPLHSATPGAAGPPHLLPPPSPQPAQHEDEEEEDLCDDPPPLDGE